MASRLQSIKSSALEPAMIRINHCLSKTAEPKLLKRFPYSHWESIMRQSGAWVDPLRPRLFLYIYHNNRKTIVSYT